MDADEAERWERLATNLRVEKALLKLLDDLLDFPVVVFKGALLTRELFGDLRVRASIDNDLWIPRDSAHAALTHLIERGYLPLAGLDAHRALERCGQVTLWPGGDLTRVSCDLHQDPFARSMFSVEEIVLLEHLTTVQVHGRSIDTFDRPLSFVHLVAHYLQHRLDPAHLWEIGVAWDEWNLEEEAVRALASLTCSEAALEFAISAAVASGHAQRAPLELRQPRARWLARLTRRGIRLGGASTARFLSLLLASPPRIPRQIMEGVVLEPDDLLARYGPGNRLLKTFQRALQLIARG